MPQASKILSTEIASIHSYKFTVQVVMYIILLIAIGCEMLPSCAVVKYHNTHEHNFIATNYTYTIVATVTILLKFS